MLHLETRHSCLALFLVATFSSLQQGELVLAGMSYFETWYLDVDFGEGSRFFQCILSFQVCFLQKHAWNQDTHVGRVGRVSNYVLIAAGVPTITSLSLQVWRLSDAVNTTQPVSTDQLPPITLLLRDKLDARRRDGVTLCRHFCTPDKQTR